MDAIPGQVERCLSCDRVAPVRVSRTQAPAGGVPSLVAYVKWHRQWGIRLWRSRHEWVCEGCYCDMWRVAEAERVEAEYMLVRNQLEAAKHIGCAVWDVETADLAQSIIEIAAQQLDGGIGFHQMIKPWRAIDREAHAVHGIDHRDLADADPWPAVERQFRDWLTARRVSVLVSWGDYEPRMLVTEALHTGSVGLPVMHIDLMPLFDRVVSRTPYAESGTAPPHELSEKGRRPWRQFRRLAFAATYLGIAVNEPAHRAQADVATTVEVFRRLCSR